MKMVNKMNSLGGGSLFPNVLGNFRPFPEAIGRCAVDAELDEAYRNAADREYDAAVAGLDSAVLGAKTIAAQDVLTRFRAQQADALYEQTWDPNLGI